MNSDPTGWDCLLDRYLGSDCGTGSQVTVLPNTAEDFHLIKWWCQPAVPQTYHPFKTQLLYFSGESLWPRVAGTVINSVKTALCYLLYLKMVFIDWNFPELIWPSVKFTIHTTPASVN